MHQTKSITLRIFLCHRDGTVYGYASLEEAAHYLPGRFIKEQIETPPWSREAVESYRLINELGDQLDPAPLLTLRQAMMARRVQVRRHPGAKRRHGRYFRRIRTVQERRMAAAGEGDPEGPPVRTKRNARNLPSDWSDLHRDKGRSWKRYRKTQWKP